MSAMTDELVLVPRVPDDGMKAGGFESAALEEHMDAVVASGGKWLYDCREAAEFVAAIYSAMLAAAPQPPAEYRNDGNSEADFIAHHADACTACGGSGHAADQRPNAETGNPVSAPAEAQAQGGGEVVAGTSKATLHRDRAGCEWFIVTSDESPDDESEVTPSDDPALFAFLRAVTAPPSAPVGVEGRLCALADELMAASEQEDAPSASIAFADASGRVRTLAEALAQQPEAVDGAMAARILQQYLAHDPGDVWPPERQGELRIEALRDAINSTLGLPSPRVDEAMVDRYVAAVNTHLGGLSPKDWEVERFNPAESIRRVARIGLTAALAQPQGGA